MSKTTLDEAYRPDSSVKESSPLVLEVVGLNAASATDLNLFNGTFVKLSG